MRLYLQEKNPLAFGQSLQVVVDASEMEMQDLIQNQSQEIVENLLDDWKQDWQPFMEKVLALSTTEALKYPSWLRKN